MKKPAAHRRPPLPHWEKGAGFCRWCGGACEPHRYWHGPCVTAYKIACWPAVARKAIWARDKGICGGCGANVAAEIAAEKKAMGWHMARSAGAFWQADHIIPLVEANRSDLSLWSLTNLRLLCTACHKGQTTALAGRLAARRKEQVHL